MNNDIIKLLNLEDDCVINSINISANQTKTISLSNFPPKNTVLSAILECIPNALKNGRNASTSLSSLSHTRLIWVSTYSLTF